MHHPRAILARNAQDGLFPEEKLREYQQALANTCLSCHGAMGQRQLAIDHRDLVAVGYDLIDLNMACPAPKVLRRQRGGALLDEPDTVLRILEAVKAAVTCPVLMKLRVGVDHQPGSQDRFWEIVTRSVAAGIDAHRQAGGGHASTLGELEAQGSQGQLAPAQRDARDLQGAIGFC